MSREQNATSRFTDAAHRRSGGDYLQNGLEFAKHSEKSFARSLLGHSEPHCGGGCVGMVTEAETTSWTLGQ
jgi:hypothetical protein